MKRISVFFYCICFSLLFTSGCWDRIELNDRAIWIASGWDDGKKKNITFSGQIVIPSSISSQSGGGNPGTGNSYFTVTASGRNPEDAIQKLQEKISRQAFMGQRRIIFLGEKIAERGLKENIESIVRTPAVSIRTGVFVIKNGTAKDAFSVAYPLEKIPAMTALKVYEQDVKRGDDVFLKFLYAANSDGIRPTLPAMEIGGNTEVEHSEQGGAAKSSFELVGTALFDKNLKLSGYINAQESKYFNWLTGIAKKNVITTSIEEGNASIILFHMSSKIIPEVNKQNQVKVTIELTGKGELLENNTDFNLLKIKNVKLFEKKFEQEVKKEVLALIHKIQKEQGPDVFGFGEVIHRKHPYKWKKIKDKWDEKFLDAEVAVKVNITIKQIGLTGPPVIKIESETKK